MNIYKKEVRALKIGNTKLQLDLIKDNAVSHRGHETCPEEIRNEDREEIGNLYSCTKCSFAANDDKQLNNHIFMDHHNQIW